MKKALAETIAKIQKKIDDRKHYLTTDEYTLYVAHTTDKDKIKMAMDHGGFARLTEQQRSCMTDLNNAKKEHEANTIELKTDFTGQINNLREKMDAADKEAKKQAATSATELSLRLNQNKEKEEEIIELKLQLSETHKKFKLEVETIGNSGNTRNKAIAEATSH